MRYKYYSKIFFKNNNARDFNISLFFPFIATVLCSLITLTTYSIIQSLENSIVDKIVAINNHARIYIDSNSKDFKHHYLELSKFLDSQNKRHELLIEAKGLITYDNKNFKVVNVVGVKDVQTINDSFGINLSGLNDKVLIGYGLDEYLNIPGEQTTLSIFAPLDGFLFVPHRTFEIASQKFSFTDIHAINQISLDYVFINYEDAVSLFSNTPSHIGMDSILDDDQLDFIYNNIEKVKYQDWKSTFPLFFSAIKVEKYLYTSFGFLLIVIASFNLYGIINLIIYRKNSQLAMLLYKGESINNIRKIFINNILIIGLSGSFIGILIAYLLFKFNLLSYFTPLLSSVEIEIKFIPVSLLFNLVLLYIGTHIAIRNSSNKIVNLKSNAIEN